MSSTIPAWSTARHSLVCWVWVRGGTAPGSPGAGRRLATPAPAGRDRPDEPGSRETVPQLGRHARVGRGPNRCRGRRRRARISGKDGLTAADGPTTERHGALRSGMSEATGRPVDAGSDVSKAVLDVALAPGGQTWRAANDEAGIGSSVARLRAVGPVLVVLEATGGMAVALAGALAVAGLPVAVVTPRPVRDVARSTGRLATTDRLDAQVLARFADRIRPEPRPLPD